jgi:D-glycero-alpha-D-manno-heptose-7-phosphate kinase
VIISRSPLRISLGGGGTDLPSYSNIYGGYVLSAAIDKYVYVSANRPFEEKIKLKYSDIEEVKRISDIRHPLIREVLRTFDLKTPQIEIASFADIPAGTGLGSSGSFTTSLIKTLSLYHRLPLSNIEIAELACKIEIEILGEPVGKQDQYISAIGGITEFYFNENGVVQFSQLPVSMETIFDLEDNLLLFFTGSSRSASDVLRDQDSKSKLSDQDMLGSLHSTKKLGNEIRVALLSNQTHDFGLLMHEHWLNKRSRSNGISNEFVDMVYNGAVQNGAVGGKLVGAGGGGFLLFYAKDKQKLRVYMKSHDLQEVRFKFDFEGTKVVLN